MKWKFGQIENNKLLLNCLPEILRFFKIYIESQEKYDL